MLCHIGVLFLVLCYPLGNKDTQPRACLPSHINRIKTVVFQVYVFVYIFVEGFVNLSHTLLLFPIAIKYT